MTDTSRPLLLAVVNDFPIVTAGLAALLEPYAHEVEVEQFVGDLPSKGRFDVLLLDVHGHPDPTSRVAEVLDATGAAVLVFSWAESEEQIDESVRLGAAGFLSKTLDGERIVAAVAAAAAGRRVRSAPAPGSEVMAAWPGQPAGLTARESDVLSLIASGLSNHAIASRTYLSIKSVKSYVRSAYRKMGVTSRSQAVLWAVENGFRTERTPL